MQVTYYIQSRGLALSFTCGGKCQTHASFQHPDHTSPFEGLSIDFNLKQKKPDKTPDFVAAPCFYAFQTNLVVYLPRTEQNVLYLFVLSGHFHTVAA